MARYLPHRGCVRMEPRGVVFDWSCDVPRTDAWSIPKLKGAAARDFQKAVRMEAADANGMCICVTCGARKHYKDMNAGHFVSGRSNGVLFVEENVHVQCVRCNKFLSGNQEAYTEFMLSTYGEETVDAIRAARHKTVQFSRDDLLRMRAGYRDRWKEQEKRLARQ